MTNLIPIAGTTLALVDRGLGRPLLFLHAGEGLTPERPWLELLSRRYRVIAPWHPGYGNSPLIDGSGSVDDLAYLYLDLAVELGLENAILVGRLIRRLDRGGDDGALNRAVLPPRARRSACH